MKPDLQQINLLLCITNPYIYIQCFFWLRAFPVYLHYRLTEAVMRAKKLDQVRGRGREGEREGRRKDLVRQGTHIL
jgi:hypothetical protein